MRGNVVAGSGALLEVMQVKSEVGVGSDPGKEKQSRKGILYKRHNCFGIRIMYFSLIN